MNKTMRTTIWNSIRLALLNLSAKNLKHINQDKLTFSFSRPRICSIQNELYRRKSLNPVIIRTILDSAWCPQTSQLKWLSRSHSICFATDAVGVLPKSCSWTFVCCLMIFPSASLRSRNFLTPKQTTNQFAHSATTLLSPFLSPTYC